MFVRNDISNFAPRFIAIRQNDDDGDKKFLKLMKMIKMLLTNTSSLGWSHIGLVLASTRVIAASLEIIYTACLA